MLQLLPIRPEGVRFDMKAPLKAVERKYVRELRQRDIEVTDAKSPIDDRAAALYYQCRPYRAACSALTAFGAPPTFPLRSE